MHSRQEGPVDWQPKAEQIQTVAWQLTFDAVQVSTLCRKRLKTPTMSYNFYRLSLLATYLFFLPRLPFPSSSVSPSPHPGPNQNRLQGRDAKLIC